MLAFLKSQLTHEVVPMWEEADDQEQAIIKVKLWTR
jgi:hypothetical protein